MFACSSMQLANRNKYPPIEALCYYTRALSGLRRQLHAQQLKGSEVWLLAVTILLHCFEVSNKNISEWAKCLLNQNNRHGATQLVIRPLAKLTISLGQSNS